jgi:hypothetical protein
MWSNRTLSACDGLSAQADVEREKRLGYYLYRQMTSQHYLLTQAEDGRQVAQNCFDMAITDELHQLLFSPGGSCSVAALTC